MPDDAGFAAEIRGVIDADPPNSRKADTIWQQYLQRDDHGQVISNLANAALALRQAPDLAGLVSYDEMLRHSLLRRTAPGSRLPFTDPRPIQDADVGAVQEWLQRHELRKLGKETMHQALDLVAREHAFHPVRIYLSALHWDGQPRIGTWLTYYLGVEKSDYADAIGKWFLIAMAARIMQPGCKADYALVLQGEQGAKKSTACAILGGAWFSDSLPELHHSDPVRLSMHLRGKWLIEIAELSSISKAEAGALKAFLTQTEERYTPKYGRNEVIEPRQCLFIGTTNKALIFRDETGGRRFWPVTVTTIDTDALAHDRDQLFAEAFAAFKRGEKWWPDAEFEKEHITPQQEERYEADAWETDIYTWLEARLNVTGVGKVAKCTVAEIAQSVLKFDGASRLQMGDQRRITAALTHLGWSPGRDKHRRWWQKLKPEGEVAVTR